jgi:hypothetical protein
MNPIQSYQLDNPKTYVAHYYNGDKRMPFTVPSEWHLDQWKIRCQQIRKKHPQSPNPLYEDVYAFKKEHGIS